MHVSVTIKASALVPCSNRFPFTWRPFRVEEFKIFLTSPSLISMMSKGKQLSITFFYAKFFFAKLYKILHILIYSFFHKLIKLCIWKPVRLSLLILQKWRIINRLWETYIHRISDPIDRYEILRQFKFQ